jgi:alkaline phosphatase D
MKYILTIILGIQIQVYAQTQNIIAGPMLGNIELRNATIWAELKPNTKANLFYWKKNTNPVKTAIAVTANNAPMQWFNVVKYAIVNLEPNTTYEYIIEPNITKFTTMPKLAHSFTTKQLWQWRGNAPDVTFLTGSCAYFNYAEYDRPGKPYGLDSTIFLTMANEKADFMMWLGDNWYTREIDFSSHYGMENRASQDRRQKVLQPFLKAMPHYAIWDDHEFGPNDADGSFIFKETAKKVFDNYWCNPTSGQDGKGTYTKFSFSDVDFFMLDDRYFRTSDKLKDTVDGKPNTEKAMIGKQQMEWLKASLLFANNNNNGPGNQTNNASFKIICVGSQVLSPKSRFDKWADFKTEFNELVQFIKDYNITGVVFFSGDRHHTEINKVPQEGMYPLYDITISPLTSSGHEFGKEGDNTFRVLGVDKIQNYGQIKVTGKPKERILTINIMDIKGKQVATYSIKQNELDFKP